MRKARVCGTRKYDLTINTPKIGQLSQQNVRSIDCLRLKICSLIVKTCVRLRSGSPLGGSDVRTDQNDQKVDFEYPPPNLPWFAQRFSPMTKLVQTVRVSS